MILSLNKKHVQALKAGTKLFHLTKDKRWKVGMEIQFYDGLQLNKGVQFSEGVCTGLVSVEISSGFTVHEFTFNRPETLNEIAIQCGFESWDVLYAENKGLNCRMICFEY